MKPILEDPAVEKIGQNLKYDMIVLRAAGIEVAGVAFDTMVASYLLEAGRRNHNLDELAQAYLHHETIKISELIGKGKDQKRMDEVPVRRVADYAGEDAWLRWRLRPILAAKLEEAGLSGLMRAAGIAADRRAGGDGVQGHQGGRGSAGRAEPPLRPADGGAGGGDLRVGGPAVQHRLAQAASGSAVRRAEAAGDEEDRQDRSQHRCRGAGRACPAPPAAGEDTGVPAVREAQEHLCRCPAARCLPGNGPGPRLVQSGRGGHRPAESSDPNLQNIPVRTEAGREIRTAFVPGQEGWVLLAADYSQIELRVLAHFSGDARLRAAFARDEDIHARVASQVNGVPLEQVTPEMRRGAKAVNFGVIYGQGPSAWPGRWESTGGRRQVHRQLLPGVSGHREVSCRVLAECHRNGYVSTILGRRREISGVRKAPAGDGILPSEPPSTRSSRARRRT